MTKKKKSFYNRRPMEGYININRTGIDFNNLDIEGRHGGDADTAMLVNEITREIEDQKRLLDIKVKLEGGGYGYVFTLRHVDHITRFNCHLCEVVIIGQTNVDEHILGKKHQVKMATPYHNPSLFPRIFTPIPAPKPPPPPPVVLVPVLPPPPPPLPEVEVVQPVIPGFEEKLLLERGVAQIQPTLDRHTSSPLVGLEYLVELTPRERDEEPMYVCTLCEKRGDPRVAMAHITSYNHRSRYLGINFPKASRAIALALPRSKEGRQGNVGIVSQICAKIEEKHGRLIPLTIDAGDYEEKKDFYRLKLEHDMHFRETSEETYTDVVDTLTTTYTIKLEDGLTGWKSMENIKPSLKGWGQQNFSPADDNCSLFKVVWYLNPQRVSSFWDSSGVKKPAEVPLPAPAPEPEKREDPKRKIAADRSRIRPHASKCDDKKDDKVDDKKNEKKVDKIDDKKVDKKDEKKDDKRDEKKDDKRDEKKDYKKDIVTKAMESKKPSVSGKPKKGKRSDSLSSISSVSSSSLSRSPSPSRSRSRSKSRSRSVSPFNRRDVYKRFPERRANRNSRRRRSWSRDRRSRSRSPSHRGRNRSRSRSESKGRYRNPPFKWADKKRAILLDPIAVEKEKWTNFREELSKVEQRLTKSLKFHEKNPEKHPLYPDEWKKFWNKRYKEIQASGQDPSKHDFKPEWIEFWNVRMKEMHHGELQKAKEELRKALNLPKDNSVPPVRFVKRPPPQPVELDDDIIVISPPSHSGRDIKQASRKSRKRSPSPWDDEESYKPSGRQYSRSKASSYSDRPRGYNRPPSKPHYEEDDPVGASNEPIKVVTVLRLVTALESQLGSIGPTVNNLLASALAMEKNRPGSSEVMLGNTDNLVLFDTVKEKLKGQLFAGIVEQGLLLATRSCIQNLAELLYRAENMPNAPTAQAKPAPLVAKPVPVSVPVVVPEVGAMNKVAIAEQIAAALIAQGKTDVTHEELEQLINAVVGMAQASANMDTPMTTAAFASLQQKPTTPPPSAPPPPTSVAPPAVSPPTPTPAPPIMPDRSPLERLLSVVHSKTTPPAKPVVSSPLFPCVETNIPEAPRAPSISSSPPKKQKREPSPEVKKMSVSYMEDLNESDLKELLQNFSHLSSPEQHCLIAYLKKLEATDPDRVEKLRKFVNLSPIPEKDDDQEPRPVPEKIRKEPVKEKEELFWKGRLSPFSMRMGGGGNTPLGGANPSHDEPVRHNEDREVKRIKLDDSEEDDDYSYEDIYAAASKKVHESEKEKEQEKLKAEAEEVAKNYDFDIQPFNKLLDEKPSTPAVLPKKNDPSAVLRETKLMIANLMGQLPLKFSQKNVSPPTKNVNPSTPKNTILPTTPTPTITTPTKPIITTPTEDLPKRSKIGTNIDISNNLTDAASMSTAEVSGINVVSGVRPVPTLVSAPSPDQTALPYNPQYQPFHEEGPYQGGYPNQHYQQGYPGPEYNGFYPGQPQEPPQEYRPPLARGYPPQQQGYPHPRPMQPPYGGAGPPQQHRYPNQYGGPGPGYNQFPQHPPQGYY